MFRCTWLPLSLTLVMLVLVPNATGAEGRKLPKLVPSFDGEGRRAEHSATSPIRRTTFQRAADRVRAPARIVKSREESAFRKLNTGTKRLLSKTKRALTPWNKSKARKAKPTQAKRSHIPFWHKRSHAKAKRPLFKSLFAKQQPPPKPTTVPEWLGHPKP